MAFLFLWLQIFARSVQIKCCKCAVNSAVMTLLKQHVPLKRMDIIQTCTGWDVGWSSHAHKSWVQPDFSCNGWLIIQSGDIYYFSWAKHEEKRATGLPALDNWLECMHWLKEWIGVCCPSDRAINKSVPMVITENVLIPYQMRLNWGSGRVLVDISGKGFTNVPCNQAKNSMIFKVHHHTIELASTPINSWILQLYLPHCKLVKFIHLFLYFYRCCKRWSDLTLSWTSGRRFSDVLLWQAQNLGM